MFNVQHDAINTLSPILMIRIIRGGCSCFFLSSWVWHHWAIGAIINSLCISLFRINSESYTYQIRDPIDWACTFQYKHEINQSANDIKKTRHELRVHSALSSSGCLSKKKKNGGRTNHQCRQNIGYVWIDCVVFIRFFGSEWKKEQQQQKKTQNTRIQYGYSWHLA